MMRTSLRAAAVASVIGAVLTSTALAHITPPVVLVSDREAIVTLLPDARRFFVREVRLSSDDRQAIQKEWGWTPDEDFYRFYLGRDTDGRLLAATIFVTDFTIHGPVRVAVGLTPEGKIRGATVVEVTEETYPWVKPLIDMNFPREYIGHDSRAPFKLPERLSKLGTMPEFYAQVVASLIHRGAILYERGVVKRAGWRESATPVAAAAGRRGAGPSY